MSGYEKAASILKALGHPTRLRIVQILRQEESCVCHLEAILGERQATISQHLSRLREAGLVVDQREGMNVYYALSDSSLGDFLDAVIAMTASQTGIEPAAFPDPHADSEQTCPCPRCRDKQQPANSRVA